MGAGFYNAPVWSPDSQKIAYFDNSESVYWLDVKSGVSKKVAAQPIYGPVVIISYAWSPDSKWLAYAMDNESLITTVYVHSTEQAKSFQVSDGLSDVRDPVFDKSGKYLFFLASTDAGPVKDWFAQSNADMRATFGDLPRRAAERSGLAARAGKRRGKAGGSGQTGSEKQPRDVAADKSAAGKTGRSDAGRQVAAETGPAVPHRHRRARIPHPRSADSGQQTCRTCRWAQPARSTT